jgi:hypothetical protein
MLVYVSDTLAGSKTYQFTCTMTWATGSISASLSVYANIEPSSGSFQATPSSGYALTDVFLLQMLYWVDSDLPLAYSFAVLDSMEIPLSASTSSDELEVPSCTVDVHITSYRL